MSSSPRPKKRSSPRGFRDWGQLLVLSAILVVAALLSAILGMRYAVRRAEVEVPPIQGYTLSQAREILSDVDLELERMAERYHDEYPAGVIIAQSPSPLGKIKAKRAVRVVTSLGKRERPVPDLVGSELRVARLKARQENYEIGRVSEIVVEGTPDDKVLRQSPAPGSNAETRRIDVLVSRGNPGRYSMPDLTGKNINEVRPYLERLGFKLAGVEYRFYSNVGKGTVVRQFPEPRDLLRSNDSVNLEVAR